MTSEEVVFEAEFYQEEDWEGDRFLASVGVFEDSKCVFVMPKWTQNNPVIDEEDEEGYHVYMGEGYSMDEEVANLDEEKMKAHILDCVAALAVKQRACTALKKPHRLTPDGEALTAVQQAARNKVFVAAACLLLEGLTGTIVDDGRSTAAVRELSMAFPDKLTYRRGWLPLQWAVAAADAQLLRRLFRPPIFFPPIAPPPRTSPAP